MGVNWRALIFQGWYWLNLPPPPRGYEYVTDYYTLGFIGLVVGFLLIGVALLVYSTMRVEKEA